MSKHPHMTVAADANIVGASVSPDTTIEFMGDHDRMVFFFGGNNVTVNVMGHNQEFDAARVGDVTIADHSRDGLILALGQPTGEPGHPLTVKDFNWDQAGKVILHTTPTYTMDAHSPGVTMTGLGLDVDFQGFRSISQLASHVSIT